MKYRMQELLCCPHCEDTLKLFPFIESIIKNNHSQKRITSPHCKIYCGQAEKDVCSISAGTGNANLDCEKCFEREIEEGILLCKCGRAFPIISRIPRFIENGLESFPEFMKKNGDKIKKHISEYNSSSSVPTLVEEYKSIHDSFSQEWSFFEYEQDKTWGWDTADRKSVFLNEIGLKPSALKNKLLLDAGCGNGILTTVLSDFGVEVVGMDISESVSRAEAKKRKFSQSNANIVHFVQGNLFSPPFREGAFDFIYSSGVLHHCPDTKATFLKLVPLVKKGGRMFIWVYGKRGLIVRAFMWHGRALCRQLSLKNRLRYCNMLAPFYKVGTEILSNLRIYDFRKRSLREITLDLFDAFSPQYNHMHTPEELSAWFREQQFHNTEIAGISKHGLGIRGDKG